MTPELPLGDIVRDAYGIDTDDLDRVHGGSVNRAYRLSTGGASYFFKLYAAPAAKRAWEMHRMVDQFSGRGIPVVRPLPTGDCATWMDAFGTAVALFPLVLGRTPEEPVRDAVTLRSMGCPGYATWTGSSNARPR